MQNTRRKRSFKFGDYKLIWPIIILLASLILFSLLYSSKVNAKDLPQLTTNGKNIEKSGQVFKMQGVNFGGLFETERYLNNTPFGDWKTMLDTNQNDADTWGKNFWNQDKDNGDLAKIKKLNVNTVRLPFTYMNLIDYSKYKSHLNDDSYTLNTSNLDDLWPKGGDKDAFSQLDNFIQKAENQGLYVVLDLHGAFGSQNGQEHSGQVVDNGQGQGLYGNSGNQKLTKQLWQKIANHYKNSNLSSGIAGYDLLNEPNSQHDQSDGSTSYTGPDQWSYYDQLLNAIRNTGDNHIAFIESVWSSGNLPNPSKYGNGKNGEHWYKNNVVYSYHEYLSSIDKNAEYSFWDQKYDDINNAVKQGQGYDVPTYIGEFSVTGSGKYTPGVKEWQKVLNDFNKNGYSWTVWNYRAKAGSGSNSNWGIYNEDDQHVSTGDTGYGEWSKFGSPQNLRKNDMLAGAVSDNSTPN